MKKQVITCYLINLEIIFYPDLIERSSTNINGVGNGTHGSNMDISMTLSYNNVDFDTPNRERVPINVSVQHVFAGDTGGAVKFHQNTAGESFDRNAHFTGNIDHTFRQVRKCIFGGIINPTCINGEIQRNKNESQKS